MSPKTGLSLDFSDFNKKFYKLVNDAIPEDAQDGLVDAMNELLNDAITKPPQAPRDIGDLWGSIAGTTKLIKGKGGKLLGVSGGFDIAYAARHHEVAPGTFKYTKSSKCTQPGPKFLQSKMTQFKKDYMELVAKIIRRGGR